VPELFDIARRIAAVKRRPVTRWTATIGLAIRIGFHARAKFVGTLLGGGTR